MTHGKTAAAPLGILAALLGALLYLPTLQFGWVWDDAGLVASRGSRGVAAQGFRPFASLLFRGEWMAGLGSPAFYHAVSLALHGIATWLLFRLARGLGAAPGAAFAASLLFAVHPIHAEAVAYVSGRPDLLATVCALGALVIARSAPVCGPGGYQSWRVWPAYGLLALAVISDEVALVTPLLLIGLDRWGSPRLEPRPRLTLYAGFTAVALAALLARIGARAIRFPAPHDSVAPEAGPWAIPIAAFEFLKALVVPYPLDAMRSLSASEAGSWSLRLGALLALAALGLWILWRRKDPLARAGALLLVLPLIPALPISPFEGAYVEDRAAYFASAGFCILAGSLYAWLARRSGPARTIAAVFGVGIIALAGLATLARMPIWKNNVSLLAETARLDPSDPSPQLAIADQYAAVGNWGRAMGAVDRAIAIDSTNAAAFHKRTIFLSRLERYPEAEAAARRALMLDPRGAVYWANLGDILTHQGKAHEAVDACRRSVELDSTDADGWYNFGVALVAIDSLAPATRAYERAIAINPNHFQAINNLGAALGASGRIVEARDAYQRAVAIAPASVESHMNLALAYFKLNDRVSASREREVIQRLNPTAGKELADLFSRIDREKAR